MGGSIVNLPIGNTEIIARKIQSLTGSDLFKIQTVQARKIIRKRPECHRMNLVKTPDLSSLKWLLIWILMG
ncbi:MAG: hypothetical protein A2X82_16110 [Geobacteraceae bacterium GWC2_55_20]|nr:MAG: hypothetical protein A2X82_16110 [Geobacteraceae bacterium GWC2_55_20]OGU24977.1 MAG: hypothetical protein A2X85_11490 [Geobacteraceae bacterium GWF2_54_21]HBA70750.1 hypothetical protein [Geobacter sp.]HCE67365.1 hypothetical protein [Geobacter sp.]